MGIDVASRQDAVELRGLKIMTNEPEAIEVEVVEIDGATPPARKIPRQDEDAPQREQWRDWQKWQGRVRQLDSRWWPLWVFVGAIALVLMLTFGVVIGVVFLIFRMVNGFFRMLLR